MFLHRKFALALILSTEWLTAQPAPTPSPGLKYSTYLRDGFTPNAIATDSSGNVYLAGKAIVDPITQQTAAMVVKINPTGSLYIYVRTLGGSSNDVATSIAVDNSGNAFVAGTAASSDFPVTPGRQLATAPGVKESRTFLAKFDPQGSLVYSELLGGSASNSGLAVAVSAKGEIVVSGVSNDGFPATPGAFNAGGTGQRPFLTKLDPSGTTVQFAAFGIGGNSLAVDSPGNIYIAGATTALDYPTTPGTYQPTLKLVTICFGLCQIGFPATNQYLTKVDAAGANLIYSTGVAGTGQTTNAGLAVDAAGNAYLTGRTYGGYPYTTASPTFPQVRPFLTKIDAAGQNALFSIPIGGAGVALDAKGNVFVGGSYNNINLTGLGILPRPAPALPLGASTASICQENDLTTMSQAYVSQVDATQGTVIATQLVDSSALSGQGVAVSSSGVWITGATVQADVPITPAAILPSVVKPGFSPGAFLGQIDFSAATSPSAPQISCMLDAGNLTRVGPAAPFQLLSLFGSNLGPDTGIGAPDTNTTSLGGVNVTFDGKAGQVLYVSSSQINVAVPAAVGPVGSTVIQVNANGNSSAPRRIPLTASAPGLFANLTAGAKGCDNITPTHFLLVARNQDGSPNSCSNPAKAGSVVSLFLNGLGGEGISPVTPYFPAGINVAVRIGPWSAEVVNVQMESTFVWRVDVRVPSELIEFGPSPRPVILNIEQSSGTIPVGPLILGAQDLDVNLWVNP